MEDSGSAWAFFGVLVGFKVVTLTIVVVLLTSWDTVQLIVASHVLWIGVGIAALWAPAAFWIRLARVRAKRQRLVGAEWRTEDVDSRRSLR